MSSRKKKVDRWAGACLHLSEADPRMGELIRRVGPCGLEPADDYLAMLARSIISQQISTAAAKTIYDRVSSVMPRPWDVRSMDRLDHDFLQKCGVSQQKRNYLMSLIDRVGSGRLQLEKLSQMEDEEVIAELVQVKGIGRWTAEMFLIFGLNRPDVLPVHDLGIKEGLKSYFGLEVHPKPEECKELTQHWRPYRSVAIWYLWRMRDLGKN